MIFYLEEWMNLETKLFWTIFPTTEHQMEVLVKKEVWWGDRMHQGLGMKMENSLLIPSVECRPLRFCVLLACIFIN